MATYAKHGESDYNSKTAAGCEEAGEPVFTLRAQDLLAPAAVRFWARSLKALAGGTGGRRTKAQIHAAYMVDEANRIADAMEGWPTRKVPD